MLAAIAATKPTFSTRDCLIDAAIELFATRGFQAISLRDLAGHVGLHAGSIYHHIDNKQGLLFELIEAALSDLLADTKRRMRGASTTAARVHRFVQAFVTFNLHEKHRLILITREFVNLNEEHRLQADKLKNAYWSLLKRIITEGYAEKENLSGEIDLITNAAIGMLYGQSQWRQMESTEQHLTQTLTNCIVSMIASSNKTSTRQD